MKSKGAKPFAMENEATHNFLKDRIKQEEVSPSPVEKCPLVAAKAPTPAPVPKEAPKPKQPSVCSLLKDQIEGKKSKTISKA